VLLLAEAGAAVGAGAAVVADAAVADDDAAAAGVDVDEEGVDGDGVDGDGVDGDGVNDGAGSAAAGRAERFAWPIVSAGSGAAASCPRSVTSCFAVTIVSAASASGSAPRSGDAMMSDGCVVRPASSTPSSSVLTG
jgi:hypothetical protein